jgi:hypothetical protein
MIIGIGLLLFAAVLVGVGLHHLIKTGTCSSTGYSNYGPVPTCPAGTGAWIGFVIGGIFLILIGGAVAGSSFGITFPAIFLAIGAGSISIVFDDSASSGSQTFSAIFGASFLIIGAIAAIVVAWSAIADLRSPPASPAAAGGGGLPVPSSASASGAPAGLGAARNNPGPPPSGYTAPVQPAGDVYDRIAKLADLHESGALTDEEFQREKTKLLAQS